MKRAGKLFAFGVFLATTTFSQTPGEALQSVFVKINTLMSQQQDEAFFQAYSSYLKEAKALLDANESDPNVKPYEQLYAQYEQRLALFQQENGSAEKEGSLKRFGRKFADATPFGGPEKYEDQGVANAVHKENLGKLRFGTYTYNGSPNFTNIGSVQEEMTYHLFLPASVVSMAQKAGKEKRDKRWNAVTSNKIQFAAFVNGKKLLEWIAVNPDGPDPDTYYTDVLFNEKRQKAILAVLEPGENTVLIEAFLLNLTVGDTYKPKVATGSVLLSFTENELTQLKDKTFKKERNILSPVTIYNGLNQTIKVQSSNLNTEAFVSEKIGPLQQKIFYYHSENGSGIRISYASSSKLIKFIPLDKVPFDIIRVP